MNLKDRWESKITLSGLSMKRQVLQKYDLCKTTVLFLTDGTYEAKSWKFLTWEVALVKPCLWRGSIIYCKTFTSLAIELLFQTISTMSYLTITIELWWFHQILKMSTNGHPSKCYFPLLHQQCKTTDLNPCHKLWLVYE